MWRLAYDMPPTDPRVLAADEGIVIEDLVVLRYHMHERLRSMDPRAAEAIDRQANDPTLRDQYADLEQRAQGPEMQAKLARFLGAVARDRAGGDTGPQTLKRLRVRSGNFRAG